MKEVQCAHEDGLRVLPIIANTTFRAYLLHAFYVSCQKIAKPNLSGVLTRVRMCCMHARASILASTFYLSVHRPLSFAAVAFSQGQHAVLRVIGEASLILERFVVAFIPKQNPGEGRGEGRGHRPSAKLCTHPLRREMEGPFGLKNNAYLDGRWRSLDLPSRRRHRFCCYARSLPTPHTKHTPHHQRFDSLPADHGDFEHRTPLTHHTNATGARFAGVRRFCGLCGSHPRLCFFFRSSLFFLFWAAQPCCEFRCFPSLGIHRARAATIKPHLDYYGGP